jgi:hypothetical protein
MFLPAPAADAIWAAVFLTPLLGEAVAPEGRAADEVVRSRFAARGGAVMGAGMRQPRSGRTPRRSISLPAAKRTQKQQLQAATTRRGVQDSCGWAAGVG